MNPYDFYSWFPEGTVAILAAGTNHFIALVKDTTALKFPVTPQEPDGLYPPEAQRFRRSVREIAVKGLQAEEQILGRLGKHPRILQLKGKHKDGFLLEYLPNGSVERHLRVNPYTSMKQRLVWSRKAAEGLAFIHSKNIIHGDVSVGNLLLDSQLSIKFCDFQGKILRPDGSIAVDGGSSERSMLSMPRLDRNYHDYKTNIFALRTALFVIITSKLPFLNLDTLNEDKIYRRFKAHEFPPLEELPCGDVIRNCWTGSYNNAVTILADLQKSEEVV